MTPQLLAWIAWGADNWQLLLIAVVAVAFLDYVFERHPETSEWLIEQVTRR